MSDSVILKLASIIGVVIGVIFWAWTITLIASWFGYTLAIWQGCLIIAVIVCIVRR